MGKVRTRILGLEDLEQAQKEDQKKRSAEKKADRRKDGADDAETVQEPVVEAKKQKEPVEAEPSTDVKKHKTGKKHKAALKKVDAEKFYALDEAIKLLKSIKYAGFDESVELHLNVEKMGVKGEIQLPHSIGKTVRVAVVDEKVLDSIEKGILEFDVLVAHPSYMPKLAKFAKVLGPKGLMPNPKAGTVSTNPEEVVQKFSKGSLRWKTEPKFPLIHQMVGKISFEEPALIENAKAFMAAVGKNTINAAFIKTTMSPGIKLDLNKI